MHHRMLGAGEIVFRKGDTADRLFNVANGSLEISELGIEVGPGAVLGEIGVFAPDSEAHGERRRPHRFRRLP